jgi:aquaporin related protein
MVMVKAISVVRGFLLVASQLVGAIFASFIVSKLFPTTFNVRTTLSEGTSVTRGVFVSHTISAFSLSC